MKSTIGKQVPGLLVLIISSAIVMYVYLCIIANVFCSV